MLVPNKSSEILFEMSDKWLVRFKQNGCVNSMIAQFNIKSIFDLSGETSLSPKTVINLVFREEIYSRLTKR